MNCVLCGVSDDVLAIEVCKACGEAICEVCRPAHKHAMPKLTVEGRNWQDSKCAWGYMTLCTPCANHVREFNQQRGQLNRTWGHVNMTVEVPGFSVAKCENCGVRCSPPDNNAYPQDLTFEKVNELAPERYPSKEDFMKRWTK